MPPIVSSAIVSSCDKWDGSAGGLPQNARGPGGLRPEHYPNPSACMPRYAPLILLLSLVACGGHKAPDSTPAPESGSATASAPSSKKSKSTPKTDTATAEHLLPPAPELDSII